MKLRNGKILVPEKDVLKGCLQYLQAIGAFVWRSNTGAMKGSYKGKDWYVRFGQPGVADIIGVLPWGIFVACECKSSDGHMSDAQIAFRSEVQRRRGIYVCAHSVEELVAELKLHSGVAGEKS